MARYQAGQRLKSKCNRPGIAPRIPSKRKKNVLKDSLTLTFEDAMEKEPDNPSPMINPYVFTVLLLAIGLWCLWDGWLAKDTGMSHPVIIMNRVVGIVLTLWAAWDFYKLRKKAAARRGGDPSSPDSGRG